VFGHSVRHRTRWLRAIAAKAGSGTDCLRVLQSGAWQQGVAARRPSAGVQPPHGYSALDAQASESDFDYDDDINTSLALMSDDFEFYFLGVH